MVVQGIKYKMGIWEENDWKKKTIIYIYNI